MAPLSCTTAPSSAAIRVNALAARSLTQLAHEAGRRLQRVHHQHAPQQVAHGRLEARVVPHEVGGDAQHARLARDSVARRVSGSHQVQRQEGESPRALGA
jgi:hypothetical protein